MRRLRRFGFNRIKEGFDQLPTAICFFDSRGSIVLCNRQMYRLSHYLFESDMQYLGEVERALATPPEGILQLSNMEGTYRFPDNTIWQFEKTEVTDRYGETYIQLTAADVTELCHVLGLLFEENKKLAEDEEHLQRLSENVEKIAREKELLTAKSAMHDNLAASIIVMKQYLSGDFGGINRIFTDIVAAFCGTIWAIAVQTVVPAVNANAAIIGALMVLTPGVALTMGVRDILNGDYLSGSIRLLDALLIAGSIAGGVVLGWIMARGLGVA